MSTDIETKLYELRNEFTKYRNKFELMMIDFKYDIRTLRNDLTEQQGFTKILRSVGYEIKKDFELLQREISLVKQIEQLRAELRSGKSLSSETSEVRCSFCGKSYGEVENIIVANQESDLAICNECIGFCNQIISEEESKKKVKQQEAELEEQETSLSGW